MNAIGFIGQVGAGELLVLFAAILLLFGSKRLPGIARSLGRTFEELRRTSDQFRNQLLNADREEPPPVEPLPALKVPDFSRPAPAVQASTAAAPADAPSPDSAPAAATPPAPGESHDRPG
jgi:sec-independent protein translocase protein TatA